MAKDMYLPYSMKNVILFLMFVCQSNLIKIGLSANVYELDKSFAEVSDELSDESTGEISLNMIFI